MDPTRLAPGHTRHLRPLSVQLPPQQRRPLPAAPQSPAGARPQVSPQARPLLELCRLPVMHRLLALAQRRLTLMALEDQMEGEYRRGHPYAGAMELSRAVYGDARYEQMLNRLKFADSAQCARLLAARIACDAEGLAVRTATAPGFGGEFVLVAAQLAEEISDWHELPEDTVLMDPWGQRRGPARGLLMAAGLASSELQIQRMFA